MLIFFMVLQVKVRHAFVDFMCVDVRCTHEVQHPCNLDEYTFKRTQNTHATQHRHATTRGACTHNIYDTYHTLTTHTHIHTHKELSGHVMARTLIRRASGSPSSNTESTSLSYNYHMFIILAFIIVAINHHS